MGDYDRMLEEAAPDQDEVTEILAAMVHLAYADGTFGDVERQMIVTLMDYYASDLGAEHLDMLVDRPVDTSKIAHPDATLLLCLMLAYADGHYSPPEGDFLSQLAQSLSVQPDWFEELHRFVRIKLFCSIAQSALTAVPGSAPEDQPVIEETRVALQIDETTAATELANIQYGLRQDD